jgi:hypothetical protein
MVAMIDAGSGTFLPAQHLYIEAIVIFLSGLAVGALLEMAYDILRNRKEAM